VARSLPSSVLLEFTISVLVVTFLLEFEEFILGTVVPDAAAEVPVALLSEMFTL